MRLDINGKRCDKQKKTLDDNCKDLTLGLVKLETQKGDCDPARERNMVNIVGWICTHAIDVYDMYKDRGSNMRKRKKKRAHDMKFTRGGFRQLIRRCRRATPI
jgi:hypothetical protein